MNFFMYWKNIKLNNELNKFKLKGMQEVINKIIYFYCR